MNPDTKLVHRGRIPNPQFGAVNPPVWRASTVLFADMADMAAAHEPDSDRITYGRAGTPTHRAFESLVAELEGGGQCLAVPSGLAAITVAMLATLKAGDHLLLVDCAYGPSRRFAEERLAALGVETEIFDPMIGADIERLFRPNTRLVWLEAPGSHSFEMQDVPAIAAACRARGILSGMDNTWATPMFFRPLDHGVDLSIQAATKYIVGHADAMLGTISVRDPELYKALRVTSGLFGYFAGSEEVWLGLRGLRTLAVRLRQHQDSAMTIARWLQARPEVARVLYPALPEDPGHALWRRDFSGASGLFGVVLKRGGREHIATLIDATKLFGIGFSWGAFESLMVPSNRSLTHTANQRDPFGGPTVRIHIGLEDPADLIADLEQGFAAMNAAHP